MGSFKASRTVKSIAVAGAALLVLAVLVRVLMPRFMICLPVALRGNAQTGCWVTASKDLGMLPGGEIYWYIDRFPDRTSVEAADGSNGTVVESFGRVWLFTVAPDGLPQSSGERVAVVGPLPTDPGQRYTVSYMEGAFSPGMRSITHRHPGPEAFYNLEGEMCLETPGKKIVVGPGQGVVVEGGAPMELTAIGTGMRRSLVLILHPRNHLLGTPAFDWKPKGLCGASP